MSNLKLSQFNYNLPQNLISQKPTKPRDHCRLLILDRKTGDIKHKKFFQIEKFLRKGDVVVLNDSKVIPARIYGKKTTGGKVEILLIKKISTNTWEVMLKNFKEKELNKEIAISLSSSRMRGSSDFFATPVKNIGKGLWQIKFNLKGAALDKAIYKYGQTPLPPYIKKSANWRTKLADYQTIYAKKEGSVAAPTAGLHFTKSLIKKLKKKGVKLETITLHVGLGTFATIRENNIEKHKMHGEWAEISSKTAKVINKAKEEGNRVIAVGTTSARTLEAFGKESRIKNQESKLLSGKKEVDIFIRPGYKFKIVDGIITNFHLPQTTLIILVSAFAGTDKILRAYNEAINKKYKFFSFGDSMSII